MRLKKILFLFFILSVITPTFAQDLFIVGKLKSAENDFVEIGQVPIRLTSIDNKINKTQLTDSLGNFKFNIIQGQSYELLITSIVIDTVKLHLNHINETLNLGEILVRPKILGLGEVLVKAPLSNKVYIDKQIFYPTSHQLKGASNAIEVLGNMMIQGLYMDPMQNRISSIQQRKLLVRINGSPASQKDYLRISPDQIKRVEYHDFPSMRYGDAEAVIDIILKEPIQGVVVSWNSRNAFHTFWGDAYGDVAYNWGKSELGLSISGAIHQYNKTYLEGVEHYRFLGGNTIDRETKGIPSIFKEDYATIVLRYNYTESDKTLFSAQLFYDYWNEKAAEKAMITDRINSIHGIQKLTTLSQDRDRRYREQKPSFDLYYQRSFDKNIVAINLVGSTFSSSSENKLLERFDDNLKNEIYTAIDGNRYSIIGDAFWQNSLKGGQLTMGVNFSAGSNHNELSNSSTLIQESELTNYNTYAYTQWRGNFQKVGYSLGLGYTLYLQKQKHTEPNKSHFITPQINLSFPLGETLQARYSARLRIQTFSTGETNMVEYPVNTYIIHRGNPNLKPYSQLVNQFALTFFHRKLKLSLNLFDTYARGSIMESYRASDNKIIRQLINADQLHQLHINLGGSVALLNGKFNIGGSGEIRLMQTKSQFYNHKRTAFSYDARASYDHNSWKFWASYRSNQENLNGESFYRGNGLISIGIDYRKAHYKIGLGYMTTASKFSSEKGYLAENYHTSSRSFNDTFQNTIYLSLSISLHSGKRFESSNRYIYNSDSDSGTLK